MQTGVLTETRPSRGVLRVLALFLLMHVSLAAPGLPGTDREEPGDAHPASAALANPFGSGEEDRRLLQSYIHSLLKDGEGGPELNTWEQEVFFLFGLHDYDRSGLLDGLELMKLLFDYNSYHTPGVVANELVVSMVDFLLQTQDLNQDGLLAPSELLSPAIPHTQDSSNDNAPPQAQEAVLDEKLSRASSDDGKMGAAEAEEHHEESQPQQEEQPDVKTEEEPVKQEDEQKEQVLEAAAAEQRQEVSVHAGQPEI